MTDQLAELAVPLAALRRERDRLERQIKEIKAQEQEIQGLILELLTEAGMESVRLADGLGTLGIRRSHYVSFGDHETALRFMHERMCAAAAEGRPLVNELITTKAVLKSFAEGWAEEEIRKAGGVPDFSAMREALARIGINYYEKADVSLQGANGKGE
jgi:hypothetical protein